jgi:hypothetical protein
LGASLVVLTVLAAGAPLAQAQTADDTPGQTSNHQTYEQQQQDYQRLQDQYRAAQSQYQDQTADYAAKREIYRRQHERYEHARADYDAVHGEGAFMAYYRGRADAYDGLYGPGAYARDFGQPVVYRGDDPYQAYRDSACEQNPGDRAVAGGVIGALAGGALGSDIGRRHDRDRDMAAGAVLGAAVGAGVGRSTASCDGRGYYFSYYQTFPYREGDWQSVHSGRYDRDEYVARGCRLAIAPTRIDDRDRDRYVRVCPDVDDHYRITG